MRNLLDQIAGKYEVLGQLVGGGVVEVYKVRHVFLDEVRLIHVVPPLFSRGEEAREEQLGEARRAMRLRHSNLAQLHDFTLAEDGTAFIVTEHLEVVTLEEAVRELGLPPLGLALEIGQQALRGLGYLHRGGIVHRDVGPDELVLTRDPDGQPLVKWIDPGTAKVLAAADATIPMAGMFPRRIRYAAPEQFGTVGGPEPDARGDLYSFGVLFYELLTGRCPVPGHDPFSFMAGHLSAPPLPFTESDPEGRVPADLREVVLQMLAKKPAERAQNADELARRLAGIQTRFPDREGYWDQVVELARRKSAAFQPVVLVPPPAPPAIEPPEPPPPLEETEPEPEPERVHEVTEIAEEPEPVALPLPEPVAVPAVASLPETSLPLRSEEPVPAPAPSELRSLDTFLPVALTREIEWEAPPRPQPQPLQEEVPASPAIPADEPRRGLGKKGLALAAVLVVGVLGGVVGGSLNRKSSEKEAPSAQAVPVAAPSAPAGTVEVAEAPTPPPPPEKVETVPRTTDRKEIEEAKSPNERSRGREPERRPEPGGVPIAGDPGPRREAIPAEGRAFQRGDLITPGPGIEYPEPASEVSADYPEAARPSRKSAKVRVAILVNENGNAIQARVTEGDASKLGFNEAALSAARRMRFLPATKDGIPGKFWYELIYEFYPPSIPAPAPSAPANTPPATAAPPAETAPQAPIPPP